MIIVNKLIGRMGKTDRRTKVMTPKNFYRNVFFLKQIAGLQNNFLLDFKDLRNLILKMTWRGGGDKGKSASRTVEHNNKIL